MNIKSEKIYNKMLITNSISDIFCMWLFFQEMEVGSD